MHALANSDQLTAIIRTFPEDLFDERLFSTTDDDATETRERLFLEFSEEEERDERDNNLLGEKRRASATNGPLHEVPPGPWRSLGGYFDYANWQDRVRFQELDRAIAAQAAMETDSADRIPAVCCIDMNERS